ncbi:MAG: hypothetical protein V1808_01150, partial [Candidatus Daviesbacteria bacterium]
KEIIHFQTSASKAHEKVIKTLTDSGVISFSKEAIALWIDKNLRTGGIIKEAKDTVDLKSIKLIGLLFEFDSAKQQEELLDLKEFDKKAFKALNYDLLPLTIYLSLTECSFFQELLEEYKDEPLERFIYDLAEVLSSKIKNKDVPQLKQVGITLNHIKEHTCSWLRNYWQWAYQQIQQQFIPIKEIIPVEKQENQIFTSKPPISEVQTQLSDAHEIQEINTEIEAIQQGNLKGWHLIYTPNRRLDDNSNIEIPGNTLEEREISFRQFIVRNSISCSIKPESIIRAFDWVVTVPQQTEQIRIRKEIDGETFKKIKRGAVRIFYSLDTDNKIITFFTHQKKSYYYGF